LPAGIATTTYIAGDDSAATIWLNDLSWAQAKIPEAGIARMSDEELLLGGHIAIHDLRPFTATTDAMIVATSRPVARP
jgi:hypothetical protein